MEITLRFDRVDVIERLVKALEELAQTGKATAPSPAAVTPATAGMEVKAVKAADANAHKGSEDAGGRFDSRGQFKDPAPLDGKAYGVADIRAAIHKTRCNIEGEDYRTNNTSDGYVAWHRKLTQWFLDKAAELGYAKPTAIDKQEDILSFIHHCLTLGVTADGKFNQDLPC